MLRIVFRVALLFAALRAVGALVTRKGTEGDAASDEFSIMAVFDGDNRASRATSLLRGRVTVVFGGVELDLRQATLAPEGAELVLGAYLGGIQVFVREDWRVIVNGRPTAGGIDVRVADEAALGDDAPTLRVDAVATLGGVQVTTGDVASGREAVVGEG